VRHFLKINLPPQQKRVWDCAGSKAWKKDRGISSRKGTRLLILITIRSHFCVWDLDLNRHPWHLQSSEGAWVSFEMNKTLGSNLLPLSWWLHVLISKLKLRIKVP
jgi:hypothetical protein